MIFRSLCITVLLSVLLPAGIETQEAQDQERLPRFATLNLAVHDSVGSAMSLLAASAWDATNAALRDHGIDVRPGADREGNHPTLHLELSPGARSAGPTGAFIELHGSLARYKKRGGLSRLWGNPPWSEVESGVPWGWDGTLRVLTVNERPIRLSEQEQHDRGVRISERYRSPWLPFSNLEQGHRAVVQEWIERVYFRGREPLDSQPVGWEGARWKELPWVVWIEEGRTEGYHVPQSHRAGLEPAVRLNESDRTGGADSGALLKEALEAILKSHGLNVLPSDGDDSPSDRNYRQFSRDGRVDASEVFVLEFSWAVRPVSVPVVSLAATLTAPAPRAEMGEVLWERELLLEGLDPEGQLVAGAIRNLFEEELDGYLLLDPFPIPDRTEELFVHESTVTIWMDPVDGSHFLSPSTVKVYAGPGSEHGVRSGLEAIRAHDTLSVSLEVINGFSLVRRGGEVLGYVHRGSLQAHPPHSRTEIQWRLNVFLEGRWQVREAAGAPILVGSFYDFDGSSITAWHPDSGILGESRYSVEREERDFRTGGQSYLFTGILRVTNRGETTRESVFAIDSHTIVLSWAGEQIRLTLRRVP